jgi:hypothetical protein
MYACLLTPYALCSHFGYAGYSILLSFWFWLIFLKFEEKCSYVWRILQTQLIVVYLAAGIQKVLSPTWQQGLALKYILINPNFSYFFGQVEYIPDFILTLATYTTVLLELSCTILAWIPNLSRYIALTMIFFHLMIMIFLNVHQFSIIMIAGWMLFL